jgi:nucleoside-diphosphate-sugar epimerase
MILAGKRVLVTGGSGFIGGHLVSRLAEHCGHVAVISRHKQDPGQGVAVLVGDLRDGRFVRRALTETRPEIIFHLAAFKERRQDPEAFATALEVNAQGSLNLLLAAQALSSLEAIVAVGTADEYGCIPAPFVEDARERPMNAYALSKQYVTHLCELFHAAHGLPVTVLRPTLAYGPGQGAEMFVPALIGALLEGKTFPMTSGEQTRDYVFVSDVVDALIRAASSHEALGSVINIGSGRPVRIADLARKVERMVGASGQVLIGALPYRQGETMDYFVDATRAASLLGWTPGVSLEEGLRTTIDWFRTKI